MITAQRLLDELGKRAWSGFNKDDMIWGNEDAATAQTELNIALRELTGSTRLLFKKTKQKLNVRAGKVSYGTPDSGQIESIRDEGNNKLRYYGNGETLDKTATGKPTGFYVDYSLPYSTIKLYPIPDNNYTYTVYYTNFYPVMDADETPKLEFESATDCLYAPEGFLELDFMDCIVLKTMINNNKDAEDENFQPTIAEFNARWKNFLKNAKPVGGTTYLRM